MSNLSKNTLKQLYLNLKLPRIIEEKMLLLLRQGKLSKWFSGIGQEAISVGSTYALNHNDVILPMHRNLGVFTTRNLDLEKLFSQLLGKEGGYTKGRDRTFHFGDMEHNIVGMISHLAAMLPVANGFGLAFKLKKQKRIALSFIGDGATSEGDFHEALNLAAVWELPVIFLIENNGYGLSTPTSEQYKCKDLVERAKGYGIKGEIVDGNNVLDVYEMIKKHADLMRNSPSPVLIEAKTFRIRGHEEASGVKYVPEELIEQWQKKDPVKSFERYLISKQVIDKQFISNNESKALKSISNILDNVLEKPKTISNVSTEINDVFSNSKFKKIMPKQKSFNDMRLVDSIRNSLYLKMKTDEKIIELFPEDKTLVRWIKLAQDKVQFQGLPARICWLNYMQRSIFGVELNNMVASGELSSPVVIGRDHLDTGSVASPYRETESMKDGSDAVADWPLLNALINTASGATWVSIHHGGGVGMGLAIHAGQVICADGTPEMEKRIMRVLSNDPGIGILRHADAGYEDAISNAKKWDLEIPMGNN